MSKKIYESLPYMVYEFTETEENKLTVQATEENTIHFSLEDWNDFATIEMNKHDAISLAKEIIKTSSTETSAIIRFLELR